MNRIFWKWFFLTLFAVIQAAVSAISGVHLCEIMADPASDWDGDGTIDSRGDEWVEIYNSGPGTFDLAEFYVRDALGDEPQMQLDGTLAPGEVALFYGSDAVAWQGANGFSITGLSLNNSGDQFELWHYAPGDSAPTLMDIYIYPTHAGEDDRSLARLFPEDQWVLFDSLNPYNGELIPIGSGCAPSPGEVNICESLVATDDSSWGEIKSQYR